MQARDSVQLCVSTLLFDTAGLLLHPPSGLTVASVSRLPAHCSLRAHITSAEWATAAASAFGLPDSVASQLFDVFFVLSHLQTHRIEYARAMLLHISTEARPWEVKASQRTVPLVGFMLFLMAQVYLEKQGGRGGGPTGELPAEGVLQFVKQHLSDMVVLAGLGRHGRITHAELAELRLLLREFTPQGQEAQLGAGLGHLFPAQGSSGATPSMDVSTLVSFLRSRLLPPADIRNAAAWTAVHRGVSNQTVSIWSAPPVKPHASIRLLRFSQCTVYVTAPLPHTVVGGCTNCTVVLGPVGGCLTLDGLDHCQVVALCAGIVVSRCRDTTIYVCTNSPPVLAGESGNTNVKFAPYTSTYPALEDHLNTAAVNPKLNLFKERLPPTAILPPAQCAPVVIPVPPSASSSSTTSTATRSCPCPIPVEYAEALTARAKRAQASVKVIQDAYRQLEDAGRRDLAAGLRSSVQRSFAEWLESTGQAQSITDLMGQAVAPAP